MPQAGAAQAIRLQRLLEGTRLCKTKPKLLAQVLAGNKEVKGTLAHNWLSPIDSARPIKSQTLPGTWVGRHGGDHDVYKHPARPGRIIVPRHRSLSPGVARAIAKAAGWRG